MTEGPGAELGRTLRSAREISGKSLKAVAEPAGISPAYLMKLERGDVTSPSPHILHRLARRARSRVHRLDALGRVHRSRARQAPERGPGPGAELPGPHGGRGAGRSRISQGLPQRRAVRAEHARRPGGSRRDQQPGRPTAACRECLRPISHPSR